MQKLEVKYHNPDLIRLKSIEVGDWVDLRAAEDVFLTPGEFKTISLGVSIQLPEGYEAHIAPRSSTFKNFGLIQTNGVGIVDNSYCGDDDIWKMPVYATKCTKIHVNDRICQFRIMKRMESVEIEEVESLGNKSRG